MTVDLYWVLTETSIARYCSLWSCDTNSSLLFRKSMVLLWLESCFYGNCLKQIWNM